MKTRSIVASDNSKEVKERIKQLKDSGMTYRNIADTLKEEYDINVSAQSVYGVYMKYSARCQLIESNIKYDIAAYHALGLSSTKIRSLVNNRNLRIKQEEIDEIINDNTLIIMASEREIIDKAIKLAIEGKNISDIDYKGVKITDNKTEEIMKEVVTLVAKEFINKKLTLLHDMVNVALMKIMENSISGNIDIKKIFNEEYLAVNSDASLDMLINNSECNKKVIEDINSTKKYVYSLFGENVYNKEILDNLLNK